MRKQKRRFLKSLFLAYFLFYAFSPLCYPLPQIYETSKVEEEEKSCRSRNSPLFLCEIIYSNLMQQEDFSDNARNIFILKKARATLGSKPTIKVVQEKGALTESTYTLSLSVLNTPLIINPRLPSNSFYVFYSALSPPSV